MHPEDECIRVLCMDCGRCIGRGDGDRDMGKPFLVREGNPADRVDYCMGAVEDNPPALFQGSSGPYVLDVTIVNCRSSLRLWNNNLMHRSDWGHSASMRSMAPRARPAISSGTVILGLSVTSASRTLRRSVFFMFTQTALSERG